MTIDGSGFNVSDSIPLYQNSPPRKEKKAPSPPLFDFDQQPTPSNAIEVYENRQFVVVKREEEDSAYSMAVEGEEGIVKVKKEPGLEAASAPKKLLGIKKLQEGIKKINENFDIEKEIGVENCLPCVISYYNWILSGSEFPEPVDPHAAPLHEHMFNSNTSANLLRDPFLESLHNPKVVMDVEAKEGAWEYVCLTDDLPLTFVNVPLKDLKKTIAKDADDGGVAWHQYEKGGEKFKFGILFLNIRDDESKAHFLGFQYRQVKSHGKKSKPEYALYITDPQSAQVFKFADFLRDYKGSYAKNIYMWTGQNNINYDCNKSPKEIFAEFKKESKDDYQPDALARIDKVARSTKLKIKINKRPNEEKLESEISKKSKTNNNSDAAKIHSSPEKSKNNPWASLEQRLSAPRDTEDIDDVQEKDELGMDVEVPAIAPTRKPFQWSSSSTSTDELSEHSDELDFLSHTEEEEIDENISMGGKKGGTDDIDEIAKEKEVTPMWKGLDLTNDDDEHVVPGGADLNLTNDLPKSATQHQNMQEMQQHWRLKYQNQARLQQQPLAKLNRKVAGNNNASSTSGSVLSKPSGKIGVQLTYTEIGLKYFEGNGVPKDMKAALKCFIEAEKRSGFSTAQLYLGRMYYEGLGCEKDLGIALEYLQKAVSRNLRRGIKTTETIEAQAYLGRVLYELGIFDKAFNNSKIAAAEGNILAQGTLGVIYLKGVVGAVQPNLLEALKYLKLGAAGNDPLSSRTLEGLNLQAPQQTPQQASPQTPQQAQQHQKMTEMRKQLQQQEMQQQRQTMQLQQIAMQQRQAQQQAMQQQQQTMQLQQIAMQQRQALQKQQPANKGQLGNLTQAEVNIIMSKGGDMVAQFNLGTRYEKGDVEGIPKDIKKAFECYKLSADQGHALAQYAVGRLFAEGKDPHGGEDAALDLETAFEYIKLSAEQGYGVAQGALGVMCLKGMGTQQNSIEAVKYLKLAAVQGVIKASNELGKIYAEGVEGIPKNLPEAFKYFKASADKGDVKALTVVGEMYYRGDAVLPNKAEAIKYKKMAADKGNEISSLDLGKMYLKGDGTKPSVTEAVKYLSLAADKGSIPALLLLGDMYSKGVGTLVKDLDKAVGYYNRVVEKGEKASKEVKEALARIDDCNSQMYLK